MRFTIYIKKIDFLKIHLDFLWLSNNTNEPGGSHCTFKNTYFKRVFMKFFTDCFLGLATFLLEMQNSPFSRLPKSVSSTAREKHCLLNSSMLGWWWIFIQHFLFNLSLYFCTNLQDMLRKIISKITRYNSKTHRSHQKNYCCYNTLIENRGKWINTALFPVGVILLTLVRLGGWKLGKILACGLIWYVNAAHSNLDNDSSVKKN